MKDIIWNNTLSIQVDEIDDDHRKLVGLFNILKNSVMAGDDTDYVQAVLEELICCTVWHFKHEERLMLKYDYDGLEEHRTEHDELIDSAKMLQQKYLKEEKKISGEDIKYLEHWLTGHILSADMQLGTYLNTVM